MVKIILFDRTQSRVTLGLVAQFSHEMKKVVHEGCEGITGTEVAQKGGIHQANRNARDLGKIPNAPSFIDQPQSLLDQPSIVKSAHAYISKYCHDGIVQ